jgi:CspA family cold shock protein
MSTGTVKWYDETKGYGFITPDDGAKDLFVHQTGLKSSTLSDGDKVEYEVGEGKKGPCAIDVEII